MILKNQTKCCKICFKEIKSSSIYNLLNEDNVLCESCFGELKGKFINFKIGTIRALAIYDYNETLKKLIYTFKGCYDYELKDVFLDRYKSYLRQIYHGYYVVPVPSSEVDDLKRGFNHVVEIFKTLNLPMLYVLKKVKRDKQSSKHKKDRLNVESILVGEKLDQISNRKILVVDDIYTTGSTIAKSLDILKKANPKKIEVLLIAKTIDLYKRNDSDNIH